MPTNFHEQPEGVNILHKLQPNLHKSPLVESSARLAERHGVKSGNAAEKIGRLISRLDDLHAVNIAIHDFDPDPFDDEDSPDYDDDDWRRNRIFERIFTRFEDSLLTDYHDIPQSYWTQQEELARDDGRSGLSEGDRRELADQLRDAQETGVQSWTGYLAEGQYPTWFSVYALEGMSTLATFNKAKGHYNKRSKGTVAPYPQLNPSALAKVYDAILMTHTGAEAPDDAVAEKLVQGGNFNKLYSHFLLENGAVVPTPENPEDVHGEWRVFTQEDTEDLMDAAQGTPWCIAGRAMAEEYLQRDGGKFYLFFLKDRDSDEFSQTASASIRMEDGEVSEISGLKGESKQYLEDALVPTVMEKVKGLPGGNRYLQAFDDKQRLIGMDRKFKAGEDFTTEELAFLYEFDRQITYVDTYADDPRPQEFKADLDRHLEQVAHAYGPSKLVWMLEKRDEYIAHAPTLLRLGFEASDIAREILRNGVLSGGPDSENYVPGQAVWQEKATSQEVSDFLGMLRLGDTIGIDDAELVLNVLADAESLIPHLDADTVNRMARTLLQHGASAKSVADAADWSDEHSWLIFDLCEAGMDPDEVLERASKSRELTKHDVRGFVHHNTFPDMRRLLYAVDQETARDYKRLFLSKEISAEEYSARVEQ